MFYHYFFPYLTYWAADSRFSNSSSSVCIKDTSSSLEGSEKLTSKEDICEMKVSMASKMFLWTKGIRSALSSSLKPCPWISWQSTLSIKTFYHSSTRPASDEWKLISRSHPPPTREARKEHLICLSWVVGGLAAWVPGLPPDPSLRSLDICLECVSYLIIHVPKKTLLLILQLIHNCQLIPYLCYVLHTATDSLQTINKLQFPWDNPNSIWTVSLIFVITEVFSFHDKLVN